MPSRRRPAPIVAASLPVRRLPIGTPQRRTTTTTGSPARSGSGSYSSSSLHHKPLPNTTGAHSAQNILNTPRSEGVEECGRADLLTPTVHGMSLAETKLEHQRKRIEHADSQLIAPQPADKSQPRPRAKFKRWKRFAFETDVVESSMPGDAAGPAGEVGVNTFQTHTRESSPSQRTSETGPSEIERQDSVFGHNDGLQAYQGQQIHKKTNELDIFSGSFREDQTTIETKDAVRAMYEVFGKALPGRDFILHNVGHKDGQVQFTHHSNGDFAAHQWSTSRYAWENIGRFSNIRKKIEGQLALDYLNVETAHETMQPNSLAYFRTIAEQREAAAMGLPFEQNEIQGPIPESPVERASAPTDFEEPAQQSDFLELTQNKLNTPSPALRDRNNSPALPSERLQQESPFAYQVPTGSRAERLGVGLNSRQQLIRHADPSLSAQNYQRRLTGIYPQIYCGYPYSSHTDNQHSLGQCFGTIQRSPTLNYGFHLQSPGVSTQNQQIAGAQCYFIGRVATTNQMIREPQLTSRNFASVMIPHGYPHHHTAAQGLHGEASRRLSAANSQFILPVSKTTILHSGRASMRDQLMRTAENARERNLGHVNTRSIFDGSIRRDVKLVPPKEPESQNPPHTWLPRDPDRQGQSITRSRYFASNRMQQHTKSLDPSAANFFPASLTPQMEHSSLLGGIAVKSVLRDSSPDTQWAKKPYDHTTSFTVTSIETTSIPDTSKYSDSVDDTVGTTTSLDASQKAYDRELHDWWTSGRRFKRQEEFFESIKSAAQSTPSYNATSGPLSYMSSRSTPSKKKSSTFNEAITRILIPIQENLSAYVEGPTDQRKDYFCPWTTPPDWAIDRDPDGNNSFYDIEWGTPPARIGRDPRYRPVPTMSRVSAMPAGIRDHARNRNGFNTGGSMVVGSGIDRRFNFAAQL